jgi:hypothetical protein
MPHIVSTVGLTAAPQAVGNVMVRCVSIGTEVPHFY